MIARVNGVPILQTQLDAAMQANHAPDTPAVRATLDATQTLSNLGPSALIGATDSAGTLELLSADIENRDDTTATDTQATTAIYGLGTVVLAGGKDASGNYTNAGLVHNQSALIQSGGDMEIDANQVTNTRTTMSTTGLNQSASPDLLAQLGISLSGCTAIYMAACSGQNVGWTTPDNPAFLNMIGGVYTVPPDGGQWNSGYPVGSAEYNDNYVSQAQLIGLQPELDWVTSQQSQGLFSYTFGQQGLDYLSSQQDAFIQGTLNLVPGRQMEVQAQAAYANGNYDSALALGVGSILDAGVGLVAIGGQAALSAADDAVAVASEQATDSSPGGLNLFKWGQDTTTTASGWTSGDYMLYLPNQGGAQANWAQNSSYLRQAMSEGNPIYDSYIDPTTGQQIPTGGFLNAERNLLQSKGWTFNSATGAYTPPKE